MNIGAAMDFNVRFGAFAQKHIYDLRSALITKKLSLGLFVKGDVITGDEFDEVLWRITAQGAFAKMGIVRQEMVGRCVEVGKIAAPTARDANFFTDLVRMVKQHNRTAVLPKARRAHKARRSGTDNQRIADRSVLGDQEAALNRMPFSVRRS